MLFLLVIFLLIFSTRMTKLSKALKEVNIPGLESVLRPSGVTQTMTRQKEQKSDKPVTVKLLPQSDKKEEDLSFKFIEDLSPQSCGKLLSNESPESAAFILSQLSAAYVSNFFNNFPGNTDLLLRSMVNGKQLAKTEITKMHHRLQKNYNELMEKESLEYDNQNLVASLINNLPAKTSESIFKKITQIDSSFANLMRKDIFLLEDLVNLEANQIEDIIRYVNRDLLINYLYNAAPEVRSKFLNNMTQRNRQIFEEELQNVTPFDDEQIAMINDELLEQIRRLFALV